MCDDHADELARQGAMTHAWALTPRAQAVSVRAAGVTEGTFVEAAEAVAGFYLIEAPDVLRRAGA
ncbi:hypothetical protein [Arsenicicoccus dermatophilus]|uniref:hypothetical protein n=2 Tax=Arsenicicoccus dermatophilus TaxID=1076331 RepID=UPI003917047D